MKIIQLAHRTVDELLEEIFAITSKQEIDTNDRRVLYALSCAMKNRYENDVLKWIPVSERLPETTDAVLTTYIVNGNRNRKYVEESSYYGNSESWSSPWDEYRVAGTRIEVIAWMPLPEPYKSNKKTKW